MTHTVCLGNVKVIVRGVGNVPIQASPYYISLKNHDEKVHEAYVGTNHEVYWRKFKDTYKSIRDQGFQFGQQFPIRLDDHDVVLDGHHRVSILLLLYGSDLVLHVRKGQVYAITGKSHKKKTFSNPSDYHKSHPLILYKKPFQNHSGDRKPRMLSRKA